MSSLPLLVIDSHYLCHRAFHANGHLSHKGRATGVAFGFLRDIMRLREEFGTDRLVFCFEGKNLLRRAEYPEYKRKRHANRTPDELRDYQELSAQIRQLRTEYLPSIGFKNVFCYDGYESDDIMAAIALGYSRTESIFLVTADSDLYQCLNRNVHIYSPQRQKILTALWFEKQYGIDPMLWALVKAIAGCNGDNVKGVRGVGEKTAIAYCRKQLPSSNARFQAILSQEGKTIVRRNRALVQLPYRDCPVPEIVDDRISGKAWMEVCRGMGIKTLRYEANAPTEGRHE